jgi:hypothetical protein
MTVEAVIEQAVRNAQERLARAHVPAPAYVLALFSHDPEELAAANLVIGLERDREAALQTSDPRELLWRVWHPLHYGASVPDEPQLVLTDDDFVAAQQAVYRELEDTGTNAQQYVLNRVAQRLAVQGMPFPVTDDFVAYAFDEDDERCDENIRFSAGLHALAELQRKGLI